MGGSAIGVVTNVRKSLESARQIILERFGRCDILINGAGGNSPKGTTTNEYFDEKDILDPDVISFLI